MIFSRNQRLLLDLYEFLRQVEYDLLVNKFPDALSRVSRVWILHCEKKRIEKKMFEYNVTRIILVLGLINN